MGKSILISKQGGGVSQEVFDMAIDDLQMQIDNFPDYTTAGLVTEEYVIEEILGKQVEFETMRFYDRGNISQALTLETFIDANDSTCEIARDNTWKTEILGVSLITSNGAAANGIPPLFVRVFEYDASLGGIRGFLQGNLKKEIQIDSPISPAYYLGGYSEDNETPILVTPDYRLFVDIQHSGGWTYENLQVKLHMKYTKIA